MTPQWAGSFLGFCQVILIPIPFIFYRRGPQIRAKSPLIQQMREDQAKGEKRAARAQRRQDRQQAQHIEEPVIEGPGNRDVEKEAGGHRSRAGQGQHGNVNTA